MENESIEIHPILLNGRGFINDLVHLFGYIMLYKCVHMNDCGLEFGFGDSLSYFG